MKILLAVGLLALAGMSSADTIDLHTTAGSQCLHQYHDIDTSLPGMTVTMWAPQLAGSQGGISLSFSNDTALWTGTFYGSGIPTMLTRDVTGQQLTLNFTETWYRTLAGAGRARWWCYKWTLQAGLIIR